MRRGVVWILSAVMTAGPVAGGSVATAQYGGYRNGYNQARPYDDRYDRRYYGDRDYDHHHGGIGPGKGALIGGGAGALLGGLFGGAKGALIGGGVGAGGGALLGKAHQNHERDKYYGRDYRDRYDRYGNPY